MNETENGFYGGLRKKIIAWAGTPEGRSNQWIDYLLLLPDLFHLLCALALDPEIPSKHKAKIAVALAYIVSPFDLVPEIVLGPIGLLDDLALAAWILNGIFNEVERSIVLRHWKGQSDLLGTIQTLTATAHETLGAGVWKKIKELTGKK